MARTRGLTKKRFAAPLSPSAFPPLPPCPPRVRPRKALPRCSAMRSISARSSSGMDRGAVSTQISALSTRLAVGEASLGHKTAEQGQECLCKVGCQCTIPAATQESALDQPVKSFLTRGKEGNVAPGEELYRFVDQPLQAADADDGGSLHTRSDRRHVGLERLPGI